MKYKYKSLEIIFIYKYTIYNLCAFDDYYYFESDEVIKEAEQISDKEFEEALSKIVHIESEPIIQDPQPTNKDIVENQYSIMMAITDLYEMNISTK